MSQLGQNESSVNGDDGANHHYYKVYNSGIQLKVGTYSLIGSAPLLRLVSKRCRRHHYIRRMIPGYNVLHSSIQLWQHEEEIQPHEDTSDLAGLIGVNCHADLDGWDGSLGSTVDDGDSARRRSRSACIVLNNASTMGIDPLIWKGLQILCRTIFFDALHGMVGGLPRTLRRLHDRNKGVISLNTSASWKYAVSITCKNVSAFCTQEAFEKGSMTLKIKTMY
jgi:hypothetical protein